MSESHTPEDFQRCYGWAYEPCNRPALWCGIETYEVAGWSAMPYCSKHAAEFLGSTEDWSFKPTSRTLIEARIARHIWHQ